MKNLTLSLLGATLLLCGCTSTYEDIFALEQVHRSPGETEVCVNRPAQRLLRYRATVPECPGGPEEDVDDPVTFCRDRIDILEGADFGSAREKGAAVSVLCMTALRSPSSLVRGDALRALRRLTGDRAESFEYMPGDPMADREAWESLSARWKEFCAREAGTAWSLGHPVEREQSALLGEFARQRFHLAEHAIEALSVLTFHGPDVDAGPVVEERLDGVVEALLPEAVFLTAREALFDSAEFVIGEAAETLFLFRSDDIMPALTALMELCYIPTVRIRILRGLATRSLSPIDLGGAMMTQVGNSLDLVDPGVVYHTVELYRSLTGIDNDDPHFWKEWWPQYLNEHADALSGRG